MENTRKMIIDTDMSFDDLMAILYLLNRREIEIIGITVTGAGYCHAVPGANNAVSLMHLAGKVDQKIPVARGDEEPFDGFLSARDPWRAMADAAFGTPLPDSPEQPVEQPAIDMLISLLMQSVEPVTIMCIGPLTNIAEAIEKEPEICAKIERLVIMAGALRVKGHVVVPGFTDYLKNEVTDWNTYVDPLALHMAFQSGVPITLVPLDATNQVPITEAFVESFRESARSPEARFLQAVMEHELDYIKAGIYYIWDPLTASAVVDRDILQFEQQKLDVVVQYSSDGIVNHRFSPIRWDGKPRQVLDLYLSGQVIESEAGRWVEVCTGVDAAAFYRRFIQVVNREYQA
jgi:inosine-uridine nucleoside N-ribohydrolase